MVQFHGYVAINFNESEVKAIMKNIILSIKIVLIFIIQEKKFNSFLTNICLFDEPDLLKTKLKKISSFIVAFLPMLFIFIYDKISFVEQLSRTLNIKAIWIIHIITFLMVIISVLVIITIVLFIYVLNYISKRKSG